MRLVPSYPTCTVERPDVLFVARPGAVRASRQRAAARRENTLGRSGPPSRPGCRWVEVDARLTADDVLVARHDPSPTTGASSPSCTASETDALGIMRVADLLEELPPEIGVDVDVKTSLEDALRPRERTTAALVADARRAARRTGGRCS